MKPKEEDRDIWRKNWREWLIQLCLSQNVQHMVNIDVTTRKLNGIAKKEKEVVEVKGNEDNIELIIVDLINYSMRILRVVSGEDVSEADLSESQETSIVDLNAAGKRWEGNVKGDKPFGYGCLYNEDNELMFEGWMVNEVQVCYGVEYWSDIGVVKYDGCLFEGMKHGYGVLYDRYGTIEYAGLFSNDSPYTPNKDLKIENDFSFPLLHSHLESLVIGNEYSPNMTSLIIHDCYSLNHVLFGCYCFASVETLELKGNYEQD